MKTHEISFVVQGAVSHETSGHTGKPITQSCLASLRTHFPGAEIIFSTWEGTNVDGLDFDKVLFNADPGAWNAFRPGAAEVKLDNTNRQIRSTRNGLREATRKYAAKLRSDMIFQGSAWLDHFDGYPARCPEWKIFKQRVITCSMWARDPRCPYTDQPLHPPDWVHIGLTEDIRLLWDIELQAEPESSQWFLNREVKLPPPSDDDIRRYSPEQYLWCTLLRKFGTVNFEERGQNSEENRLLTEITFANNLIILDLPQFPFVVDKYPYPVNPAYRYYRFLAHREWKQLYHVYSERRPVAARIRQAVDPAFYVKSAYMGLYGPLQTVRRLMRQNGGRAIEG